MAGRRGHYRKSYVTPHGRGFRYNRGIPRHLQEIEGKHFWRVWLGDVTRSEAEAKARAIAVEHDARIARLESLSPDELITLQNASAEANFAECAARAPWHHMRLHQKTIRRV